MTVKIKNQSQNPLPSYETAGAAGMDIRANLDAPMELGPGERKMVPTGLFIEIPVGYEAQIRPRSGLAIKKGITLLNTPGTIDSDYRGEINIIMINLSNETHTIEHGDRIAQMVVASHEQVEWQESAVLEESERGSGGFGHTGTS
jgi:dUTP pyrophosphatase